MKNKGKFRLWTLIFIVACCYFTYTVYKQQTYIEDRKASYSELQKNLHNEESKHAMLLHQKSLINTDEFAEKIAREKLGYVKDGEKIYVDTNK